MKELYLVRHAKSSWEYESVDDLDRPLQVSGIRDAHTISQLLANQQQTPQALYTSPATRAVHTAMIFARNLRVPFSALKLNEQLYMCTDKQLLDFIKTLDDGHDRVMIFGHNPTITNFVNRCIEQRIDNVPTTGTVCFSFNINSWKDAGFAAELSLFDFPKKHKKK